MAFALSLACAVPAALAASGTQTLEAQVRYEQTAARSMLSMVNDLRTGAYLDGGQSAVWAYASDGSVDTESYKNLGTLSYDYDLEVVAMQRAAEIALRFSHTRPNGESCFDLVPSSYSAMGENIAAGLGSSNATARQAFESWCEANYGYSGQGHRRNMLDARFNRIGIGHVVVDWSGGAKVHFWVQTLGYRSDGSGLVETTAQDDTETRTVSVDVLQSSIDDIAAVSENVSLSLGYGETKPFGNVSGQVRLRDADGIVTFPAASIDTYGMPVQAQYSLQSQNTSVAQVSGTQVTATGVGTTNIVASVNLGSGVQATVPVTVTPKSIADAQVTLDAAPLEYDGTAKQPAATVVLDGRTLAAETDYTVTYDNSTNAGTGRATIAGKGNYTGAKTATFEIAPAKVTAPIAAENLVYNGSAQVGVAAGEGFTVSGGQATDAGDHTATATLVDAQNHAWADGATDPKEIPWAIARKAATVTSNDASKTYGEPDPQLTATVEGALNGDELKYELSRKAGEDAGSYAIEPSGAAEQGNYAVTFQATGTLAIQPAELTITVQNAGKVRGADDPELSAIVTGYAFDDASKADIVRYTLSRDPGEAPGDYTINATVQSISDNYTAKVVAGKLTIAQGVVTVKAKDAAKTYGDADPQFEAEFTLNGAAYAGDKPNVTFSREEGENAGSYVVTPSGPASQGSYAFVYQSGTLEIERRAAIVESLDAAKTYGDEDPELLAAVSGVANGDEIAYSLTRDKGEDAGSYAIVPSGASVQGNYQVAYRASGALEIDPLSIDGETVTLSATAFTYDGRQKKPAVKSVGGRALTAETDYKVAYSRNVNAGTANATVVGRGNYTGTASAMFRIGKAANPVKVAVAKRTVRYSNVKKKAQAVKPLMVSKAVGALTYSRVAKGSSKALKVNAKTGQVTVKKGAKKGTYTIKVKVTAAGSANYNAATKTVTAKVRVK